MLYGQISPKDVNRHFFHVNEYGDSLFYSHKIKQKLFFLEKKYETIPRPKKEAAVGNMLKHVLATHNVPLHLKEYTGTPRVKFLPVKLPI